MLGLVSFALDNYTAQCIAGSGKSTWATRYVANHPEKHYALMSVDGIIKQLKVRLAVFALLSTNSIGIVNYGHYHMSFSHQLISSTPQLTASASSEAILALSRVFLS